jgi:formate hydrogenlyase subunit 6/NADH:ubiquinone oxidoreductase subunit I
MKEHEIDYSRCVVCMDCIGACKEGAIRYGRRFPVNKGMTKGEPERHDRPDQGRRAFLVSSAIVSTAIATKAQDMKLDGGLAEIEHAEKPERKRRKQSCMEQLKRCSE